MAWLSPDTYGNAFSFLREATIQCVLPMIVALRMVHV